MIHLPHGQSFEDINSLQVILTSNTDSVDNNNIRCLPGFINKTYLNRHVLEGLHKPGSTNNEIYRGREKIILTSNREELYALLTIYGYNHTFNYLSSIAQYTAQTYKIHQNLYKRDFSASLIAKDVEQNITELVRDCFSDGSNLNLTQTIAGVTYKLLGNIHLT